MASYVLKQYSGDAAPTTLAVAINASDATVQGVNLANYPDGSVGPFVVALNRGGATEEKVLCSTRSGNTLTVAASGRGYDGTTAASHSVTEPLEHVITAVDMTEANYAVTQTVGKATALGDLLVASAANTFGTLHAGSAGQVLTVSGGTWVAATPATAVVPAVNTIATSETSSSVTFADLATPGPAVTATVSATGKVKVTVTAGILPATSNNAFMGFALSGANTVAASTTSALLISSVTLSVVASAVFMLTGLSAGSTTFTAKYESAQGGSSTWFNRSIIVEAY